MKLLLILLCAAAAWAQTVPVPPAVFTGAVKHIDSGTLTLEDVREAERALLKLAGEEKTE